MESYFDRYVASGGIMMFFLVPCSFLAVWFIFQGFINLRRSRIVPTDLVSAAASLGSPEAMDTFRSVLQNSGSTLASILLRLFDMNPAPRPEEMEDVAAELIDEEVSRLYHKNNQLAVIYTVSPLLGLLGTILGMMRTFSVFSTSSEHSITQLSQGINEALVTTMWGLAIAIPSFVVLYLFKQKLFYFEMNLLPRAVKNAWGHIAKIKKEETEHGGTDKKTQ